MVATVGSLAVAGLKKNISMKRSAERQFDRLAPFRQYSRKLGQYINSLQVNDLKFVCFGENS